MKKVSVVTIFEDWNYGNKLQNYAVEQLYLLKVYMFCKEKPQKMHTFREKYAYF